MPAKLLCHQSLKKIPAGEFTEILDRIKIGLIKIGILADLNSVEKIFIQENIVNIPDSSLKKLIREYSSDGLAIFIVLAKYDDSVSNQRAMNYQKEMFEKIKTRAIKSATLAGFTTGILFIEKIESSDELNNISLQRFSLIY